MLLNISSCAPCGTEVQSAGILAITSRERSVHCASVITSGKEPQRAIKPPLLELRVDSITESYEPRLGAADDAESSCESVVLEAASPVRECKPLKLLSCDSVVELKSLSCACATLLLFLMSIDLFNSSEVLMFIYESSILRAACFGLLEIKFCVSSSKESMLDHLIKRSPLRCET